MAKVVCVLYDDPVDGYPKTLRPRRHPQARRAIPTGRRCRRRRRSTSRRANCSARSRASSGCGSTSRANGHTLVVTSDKDGAELASSIASCPTPRSSSRSRSGRPI